MPPRQRYRGPRVTAASLEKTFLESVPDDALASVRDLSDWRTKLVYGMEYARRGVSDAALTLLVDALNAIRATAAHGPMDIGALLQLIAEVYVTQENYDKVSRDWEEHTHAPSDPLLTHRPTGCTRRPWPRCALAFRRTA